MRWPKPEELRQWTPHDQKIFKEWRRAVFALYGVIIGVLVFGALLAHRQNPNLERDGVIASHGQKSLQQTNVPLSVMQKNH